ncbi:hypothetical protein H8L32_21275 [Undibacterium sp. CY18W]|uniref:Lipoprotein n=1 Tax=Undibacterium hunanense TaxID=2762292 RepID=A0ABR6ZVW7_9BURK|nr:hypothetical protein [Undibacterium hunanense]MBC3920014.1 hypothetical protein [Undibacterium hunanense]
MQKKYLSIFLAFLFCACTPVEQKQAREFVASKLKDPQSTQFRNEVLKIGILCGELNSKNSYGAYVGFKRFIASGKQFAFVDGMGLVAGKEPELNAAEVTKFVGFEIEIFHIMVEDLKQGKDRISEAEKQKLIESKKFAYFWEKYC